jgi:two-component system, NtrC family, response regulator AtoC
MRAETILIVDDERLIRWSLGQQLSRAGFRVLEADSCTLGVSLVLQHEPDLLILDQLLPDGTGIDVLREIRGLNNGVPVIMLTAIDKSDIAVQAMKLGASDYVTKPVNFEELGLVIEKALESTRLKRQVAHFLKEQEKNYGFCGLIGASPPMKKLFDDIMKIASSSETTVLITGESGTGKELAARAIHFLSSRKDEALMTVNFSALTETLIESELFGHEKGAFTDAKSQKKGVFELADKGTIFLDEIGDSSPKTQIRLLRVLEQRTFQRVGGTADISVDIRIIAATNQSLPQRIEEGKFRTDLFYRLNVVSLVMPPVRERGEDVLQLADYFLHEFNTKFHKHFVGLAESTRELFLGYGWPGNVREIRNVLERAVLLGSGELIQPDHVELSSFLHETRAEGGTAGESAGGDLPLYELERQALIHALEKTEHNQSEAARLLRISRDTLRYRMKKYSIPSR